MQSDTGPIRFHILYHPQSVDGKKVALNLFRRFVDPPLSGGLRVPVFFTQEQADGLPPDPETLTPRSAGRTIVILLSDAVMTRRVDGGTGALWAAFFEDIVQRAKNAPDQMAVLPVALEPEGFDLAGPHHMISAVPPADLEVDEAAQRQISEISFHIATIGLRLLRDEAAGVAPFGQMKAPVTLFLSHAKRDVSEDRSDPVYQTLHALSDLPVEHWFDSARIGAADTFSDALEAGIRDATIVIAFHTDHFDSRSWCRREVLAAKRHGAHVLVVNALEDAVPRQFPYLGNVPVVRWRDAEPATNARRVIDRAVLEAFRLTHNRKVLEEFAKAGDIVLSSAPEAITLAVSPENVGGKARTFLYPDPPLDHEEKSILASLRPDDRFETPLSRLVDRMSSLKNLPVAVSISTPDDLEKLGMDEAHLRTLTDEIHLYLLLGGVSLIYGGALNADPSDPENFALRLFELARSYSPLVTGLQREFQPILNIPPWPLHAAYGDRELALFGKIADLERGPTPALPWDLDSLFPPDNKGWRFAASTPQQRYAWARGLDAARQLIAERAAAQVIIGGKLKGFAGVVPGVLEETYVALRSGKPIYLVGAFGGAGRAVFDQMFGHGSAAFEDGHAEVPDMVQVRELFQEHGGIPLDTVGMGEGFAESGKLGPEVALKNGLTDAENEVLFRSTDARRIAELVLTGLTRIVD
tara:strand:+ start:2830 stop:4920 length:2091 start_codon:yes stop_codon:yes gene_type:complete